MNEAARKRDFEPQSEPQAVRRNAPVGSLATSQDIRIERELDAPVDRVWKAWTDASIARQWWGPEGFTSPPGGRIDFREGGKYLLGMKDPQGKEYWSTGTYREIVDHKSIVATDQFCDSEGNVISPEDAGMKGDWPDSLTITTQFEALGPDKTKLTLHHVGIPLEERDNCIQGWNGCLDKLEKVVEG